MPSTRGKSSATHKSLYGYDPQTKGLDARSLMNDERDIRDRRL